MTGPGAKRGSGPRELALSPLPDDFREGLRSAPVACLLSDFDGTLAPHRIRRDLVRPSPRVLAGLAATQRSPRGRVIIVTGREAETTARLVHPFQPDEIWGVPGLERRRRNGDLERTEVDPPARERLDRAAVELEQRGLGDRLERKYGALAVHWRGFDEAAVAEIRGRADAVMRPAASEAALHYLAFDGGIELRAPGRQKDGVVRSVIQTLPPGSAVAYLGDDSTDEDAFRELRRQTDRTHGLAALVRTSWRPTTADLWLRPPGGLLAFLRDWNHALQDVS